NWLFLSQGRTREYMRWGFISAATSVAAFLCGLPFGPIGVASAYSISECLRTPALWWLVGRSGPVGHRDAARVIVPHLAAAVASIVGVYLLHHWMIARLFGDLPNLLACFALSYALSLVVVALFPAGRHEIKRYAARGIVGTKAGVSLANN